jgi:protein gp37
MTRTTSIEWTEHTWNPFVGCSIVSAGCKNCYAMRMAHRCGEMGHPAYKGVAESSKAGPVWTGQINRNSDSAMLSPLSRRKAALFFVNSMSDFWHPNAEDKWRHEAFDVMAATPHHQYQVLTKRPKLIAPTLARMGRRLPDNLWLGSTVEDARVVERIGQLRAVPAAIRFLSIEPLIGALGTPDLSGIDWVITGGESGPRCRPCRSAWVREIRDHIAAKHSDIALFHKQWGHYRSNPLVHENGLSEAEAEARDPKTHGKGGALLDGRLWREFPKYAAAESQRTLLFA